MEASRCDEGDPPDHDLGLRTAPRKGCDLGVVEGVCKDCDLGVAEGVRKGCNPGTTEAPIKATIFRPSRLDNLGGLGAGPFLVP
jgi:hypothetical protein